MRTVERWRGLAERTLAWFPERLLMPRELNRKLSYSDLPEEPNDGKRYELIRGELLVTPSPTTSHQRISRKLCRWLEDYFHTRTPGEVFHAPLDVILTSHDVFVPDLLVAAKPSDISTRGVERPPLLVVEILSPSTRRRDRGLKRTRYAELEIEHYWIVDPERRTVECLKLADGEFQVIATHSEGQMSHPDFDGLSIDLAALWSQSPAS